MVLLVEKSVGLFEKSLNKRDFLKIINLYVFTITRWSIWKKYKYSLFQQLIRPAIDWSKKVMQVSLCLIFCVRCLFRH